MQLQKVHSMLIQLASFGLMILILKIAGCSILIAGAGAIGVWDKNISELIHASISKKLQ